MTRLLGLLLVLLAGCGGTSGTCPTTNTLTSDTFGKSLIDSRCGSCHSATNPSDGVNLSSAALVRARLFAVDAEVARGAMPPTGSTTLTAQEKADLAQWLACGAP